MSCLRLFKSVVNGKRSDETCTSLDVRTRPPEYEFDIIPAGQLTAALSGKRFNAALKESTVWLLSELQG